MAIPRATILFTILVTKTANFYHPPIELVIWSEDLQIHLLKTVVKIQVNRPLFISFIRIVYYFTVEKNQNKYLKFKI